MEENPERKIDPEMTPVVCRHCLRTVEQLYDVGWENGSQRVVLGHGCEDCAMILKQRCDEMASHIKASKLN